MPMLDLNVLPNRFMDLGCFPMLVIRNDNASLQIRTEKDRTIRLIFTPKDAPESRADISVQITEEEFDFIGRMFSGRSTKYQMDLLSPDTVTVMDTNYAMRTPAA